MRLMPIQLVHRRSNLGAPRQWRLRRRRAFSFVEIMFAVMILGVGFIMIAGIFPVALTQTQANGSETIACNVAQGAVNYLSSLPNTAALMSADASAAGLPGLGTVHHFGNSSRSKYPSNVTFQGKSVDGDLVLWNQTAGNAIMAEDPRFGWVALYRRVTDPVTYQPQNSAQVFVFVAQARNHSAYGPADLIAANNPYDPIATPTLVAHQASFVLASGSPDTITFQGNPGFVAPGAFVVVQYDAGSNGNSATGWVLRVGNSKNNSGQWTLAPGGDMSNSPNYKPASTSLNGWVVGQGVDANGNFTGGVQDVMVYTSYINLN